MCCKKCGILSGVVLLVIGVLYLLNDLMVWNIWLPNWWTLALLLAGLSLIGARCCKACSGCCESQGACCGSEMKEECCGSCESEHDHEEMPSEHADEKKPAKAKKK